LIHPRIVSASIKGYPLTSRALLMIASQMARRLAC
jgi:hypothetical protein